MTKHNARWYDNRIAEKQRELEALRLRIANYDWHTGCDAHNDAGNALYDQEYDLEKQISDLEHSKQTRNWTGAEWSSWELITSNID